ncbi:MAG: Hint domain-containing protein [Paracoccaceae bacterium]
MATHVITGYDLGDITTGGGGPFAPGGTFSLAAGFAAASDALTYTITDDDAAFDGSSGAPADGSQTVAVTDALGNPVDSGDVRLGDAISFTDPGGGTVTLFQVLVDGTPVGYVADGPLQPGVVYTVDSVSDTAGANTPDYVDLADATYDPDGDNSITGFDGDDSLHGGAGNDTINGGSGDDTIDGGTGNDIMDGGSGADRFMFSNGWGADTVLGGGGSSDNDYLDFSSVTGTGITATFSSWEDGNVTDGTNTVSFDNIEGIIGTDQNDSVDAALDGSGIYLEMGGGDDTVGGGSGADTLSGGAGHDTIWGAAGDDLITGGDGDDTLAGASGDDTIWGGAGSNELHGGDDRDSFIITDTDGQTNVFGGEGGTDFDQISLTGGPAVITWTGWESGTISFDAGVTTHIFWEVEKVTGTSGDDTFDASGSSSTGGVIIDTGGGRNTVTGSDYGDSILGGSLEDTIYGGGGDDTIDGGGNSDEIHGGDGDDYIVGKSGNDTMFGDAGNDTLWGYSGGNYMDGGDGNDSLIGSVSNGGDVMLGGAGDDTIEAGIGANRIEGGSDNDLITTGDGADTIAFSDGDGSDTITDFDMTDDGFGRTVDQFDVSGANDAGGGFVDVWEVAVSDDGSGNAVLTFPDGGTVTLIGVSPGVLNTAQLAAMGVPCFVADTQIDTPQGPRPVQDLIQGDLVSIRDGPPQPVIWFGSRHVTRDEMQRDARLRPIELRANSLGDHDALCLSAQHCVLWPDQSGARGAGALVRARHLAPSDWNGARVMQGKRGCTYHHILLPRHALIRANGIWAETFWPGPMGFAALSRAAKREILMQMPHLAPALLGVEPVADCYAPKAAPVLTSAELQAMMHELPLWQPAFSH